MGIGALRRHAELRAGAETTSEDTKPRRRRSRRKPKPEPQVKQDKSEPEGDVNPDDGDQHDDS